MYVDHMRVVICCLAYRKKNEEKERQTSERIATSNRLLIERLTGVISSSFSF